MSDDRLERLNDRLASGEITPDDYDQIKSRLVDEQAQIEAAREQYGATGAAPGATGGGRSGPRSQFDPESIKERVRSKLERGEGLQRPGDRIDANLFGVARLREAIDFQRSTHPELGINGLGGSYRGESQGNPIGTPVVNALVDARKNRQRAR